MPFLDWVNKNQAKEATRGISYHLLKQVAAYGEASENLLIQGDNLLALKALMPFYAGQVKCIVIDPPYNTQSAFEHYDDKLEHSQWLSMMYPRLVLLRDLLRDDGSIWVTVDDNEAHYLKILMDEVFGRSSFLGNVVWQKRFSPNSTAIHLSDSHDHVLAYARVKSRWKRNLLPRTEKADSTYKNPDDDPRGPWTSSDLSARNFYSLGTYPVTSPSGRVIDGPPPGRYWTISRDKFLELDDNKQIWWGKKGNNQPRFKRFLSEVRNGVVPQTIWEHTEVGHTQEAKKEALLFNRDDVFGTPKPERLIKRILDIASNPGDLVLDSFLGSGTTSAVAHKMGRHYIGIEVGDHAQTHCLPRLIKVIEGEQGGISKSENWQGGGGFRFCKLGDPAFDSDGRINSSIFFGTLAAFVWHFETGEPGKQVFDSPLIGIHNGTAYYLLYNGILGDKKPEGGNVLTHAVLKSINEVFPHDGPKVIYGETCRLGDAKLAAEQITFKQIPYDVKMR